MTRTQKREDGVKANERLGREKNSRTSRRSAEYEIRRMKRLIQRWFYKACAEAILESINVLAQLENSLI